MSINPDHGEVEVETLADRFLNAGDGADGDRVVTAESEDKTALGGLLVCLRGDLGGGGADSG